MNDKLGIIIQARTGSSRLPNKVILPFFKDLTILDIIIQRFKKNKKFPDIIVATSNLDIDDSIVEIAKRNNVLFFRGDETNVLNRFIRCANEFNLKKIIRVCADNPFIINEYIGVLLNESQLSNFDYISFKNHNNTPVIKTHFGLFAEFVSVSALEKVNILTDDKLYLEHVTNYIYSHPEKFSIKLFDIPLLLKSKNNLRFTCDTLDDFLMLKELYNNYVLTFKSDEIILENLINLVNENKTYLEIMQKGINQFEK